jgi:hypothetical protein
MKVPKQHHLATAAWELTVPKGVTSRTFVKPPKDSDVTSMAVCWGYLEGDVWVRIVVGTRPRKGRTLRGYIHQISGVDGVRIIVPGGRGARRATFSVERDEPVGEERFERVTVLVAAGRREFVTLAISTVGSAVHSEVDSIIASLRLLDT